MPININLRIKTFTDDYLQSPEPNLSQQGARDLGVLLEDLGYYHGLKSDNGVTYNENGVYTRKKNDSLDLLLTGESNTQFVNKDKSTLFLYLSLQREEGREFGESYHQVNRLSSRRIPQMEREINLFHQRKCALECALYSFGFGTVGLVYPMRDNLPVLGAIILGMAGAGALVGYFTGMWINKKNKKLHQKLCEELKSFQETLKAYKPRAICGTAALKQALTI